MARNAVAQRCSGSIVGLVGVAISFLLCGCSGEESPSDDLQGNTNASSRGNSANVTTSSEQSQLSEQPPSPGSNSTRFTDKLDLLVMVDNSAAMVHSQNILREALPYLIEQLGNPPCVNAQAEPISVPFGGLCPAGYERAFSPIEDINVAVITSSLGDAGADSTCPATLGLALADMAHTVGSLPRGSGIPTNGPDLGFLQWRPGFAQDNPSEKLSSLVGAAGEGGCGWESSLEAWYRFLVDPYPYRELRRVLCDQADVTESCVSRSIDASGRVLVDNVLLAQRNAFLRPNSSLAILMLTNENDCSVKVGGKNWVVVSNAARMTRGTSICELYPNDRCCHMCGDPVPAGCQVDPVCDEQTDPLSEPGQLRIDEDALNLRCYDQKRRFGSDFLYPTKRYINALSQMQLCWTKDDLSLENCNPEDIVGNPLFEGGMRPVGSVVLAGIIGVPYQSISASTASPVGDTGQPLLRFKSWQQLTEDGDWDKILGVPGIPFNENQPEISEVASIPPSTPYMQESEFERPGITPNSINGREWNSSRPVTGGNPTQPPDTLQFACIFPLLEPDDCAGVEPQSTSCSCTGLHAANPLCEEVPGSTPPGAVQYWSAAFPGLRHLEVLKGSGSNAVVASICPSNLIDPIRADYGYRPAMSAIVERLRLQFKQP